MTPQLILRIAGIAFLVISALFVALAVHYYFSQNIRAVMDDLSGKTRARGVAGTRRRANAERGTGVSRRPSRAASLTPGQAEASGSADDDVAEAAAAMPLPQMPPIDEEDDMGTVLVSVAPMADAAVAHGEDGVATMLEADATYGTHAAAMTGARSQATDAAGAAALFSLTRRVVMIHATEIIAANEEL